MWVFLTSRLRSLVIFAVLVPLATAIVGLIRKSLEKRGGETRLTKALAAVEHLGQ